MPRRPPIVRLVLCCGLIATSLRAQRAEPVPLPENVGEELTFASGAQRLSASLFLPAGPGPHPAVVMLEGSGPFSYRRHWREEVRFPFWRRMTDEMLARGVAVLLFDKPGLHRSTGDWRLQSFEDRADDALAAIAYLRSRPEVDSASIGLLGHSQGGYVAPIAAVRAPRQVAFIISLAGPAVPVKRQIRDDLESGWRCAGASPFMVGIRSVGSRLGLSSYGVLARVAAPSYLARILNHDPRPYLRRVRQPMLVLLAENDRLVPAEMNARLWREAAERSGNSRVVVRVVSNAEHGFQTAPLCHSTRGLGKEFAPAFQEALSDTTFWRAALPR